MLRILLLLWAVAPVSAAVGELCGAAPKLGNPGAAAMIETAVDEDIALLGLTNFPERASSLSARALARVETLAAAVGQPRDAVAGYYAYIACETLSLVTADAQATHFVVARLSDRLAVALAARAFANTLPPVQPDEDRLGAQLQPPGKTSIAAVDADPQRRNSNAGGEGSSALLFAAGAIGIGFITLYYLLVYRPARYNSDIFKARTGRYIGTQATAQPPGAAAAEPADAATKPKAGEAASPGHLVSSLAHKPWLPQNRG